jgi:hypothetical protein
MGELADEAIDRLFDDYDGGYDEQDITCKRCGADELYWEEARGEHNEKRWVLMEYNGSVHVCPNAPSAADADEFPTIEPQTNDINIHGRADSMGPTLGKPMDQHSPLRKRTTTDEPNTKTSGTRAVCPKRSRPVDTVSRKHDVSRKPSNRWRK